MQITKGSIATRTGPREWFSGAVYVDTHGRGAVGRVAPERQQRPLRAGHTHPDGQTIYVVEGVGRAQRRGGPVEVIRPGDRVVFAPGEEHWHGAAPERFMTHLAMLEGDDEGTSVTWGAHVTDEEYGRQPE